ncbi:MAG: DUF5666 domain-containing protein [Rubrivivax sp.]|nr:DUF5666 domain-containing protein [Rubrivivax sp.]
MSFRPNPLDRLPQPTRRQLLLGAAALGASSLLPACGGGGSDEAASPSTGSDIAASFVEGPITGFGSIIVGATRFDESAASVTDGDGGLRHRDELKLGTVVEIEGGRLERPAGALGVAVALRVVLGHSLQGPVDAVDVANSRLTLIGQTVVVTSSTVFDESISGGLAGLAAGDIVEAHALYDPVAESFLATRLEMKASVLEYRLRGKVSGLDPVARTFFIGSEKIDFVSVRPLAFPNQLVDGAFVRVRLQTTPVDGAWVATTVRIGLRSLLPGALSEAEVEGVITGFTSLASFEVNGLKVETSSSTQFPDGTTGIVAGARVEVKGRIVGGVLAATMVRLDAQRRGPREFEFHGPIASLDPIAKTFALRGLTVWYGGTVEYRNGTEAMLANDRRVEVRGVLGADRQRIEARRIQFR